MELAIDVSSAATDRFGSSVDMWRIRLEVLIAVKVGDVEQVFKKAFTEVKPKVCALCSWGWCLLEGIVQQTHGMAQCL